MKAIKSVLAERRMFAHGGPAYTSAQARSYFGANPYHLENVGPGLGYAEGIFGNPPPPPGAIAANQAARQRLSRVDLLPSEQTDDAPLDEEVGPVSPPTEFGPLIDTLVTPSLPQQIGKTAIFSLLDMMAPGFGMIGRGFDINALQDQLTQTAKIIGKPPPSYLEATLHSMGKNYFNPEDQARAAQMSGLDEHSIKGMPTGLGIGNLAPLSIPEIEAQLAKAEAEVAAYEATPAFQAITMADTEAAVSQAVAAAEAVPAITMADTEAAVSQAVAAGNVPGSVPGFGGKHGMDYGLEFGFDDSGDGGGGGSDTGGVGGGGAGGGDDTGDESGSASAPWRAGGFLSGTNYAHGGPVMTGLGFRPLHYQNGTGPDPIRSVLAERKMFVNGGLLAMDQGQNKANGILASSESLIDAVVREAMSPQGGHTLSMDQGGVARFDPDTFASIGGGPSSETEDNPRVGLRALIGLGAPPRAIEERVKMTPSERMLNIFGPQPPRNEAPEAEVTGDFALGSDSASLQARSPLLWGALDQSVRGLSPFSAPTLRNLGETIIKRGGQSVRTKFNQISSINKLLRRQPRVEGVSPEQVSGDIGELVKIYLGKNPDASGGDLELFVSEGFYQKHEVGYAEAAADFLAHGDGPEQVSEAAPVLDVTSANNTDEGTMTAAELTSTYGVEDRYAVEIANLMNSKGLTLEDAAKQVVTPKPASVEVVTAKKTSKAKPIDTKIDAKYSSNPIFDVQAAHDEFVGMMPEHESKTDGWNWIVLGLSIAAETGQDAITNMSQGALKALPGFIDDAKERDKYLRSMNLAGARYALTKRDTIETEQRQAERTMNNYWIDQDITFRDDAGKIMETFRGGQFNRLNDRQVQAIQEHTGLAIVPEAAWISNARASAAKAAANPMYEKSSNVYDLSWFGTKDKLRATFPTARGKSKGLFPVLQTPQKLVGAYEGSTARIQSMQALAGLARGQLDISGPGLGKDISGFSSIIGKAKDVYRAWFVNKEGFAREGVNADTAAFFNDDVSPANLYDQYLRLLAIQMAPILLGESGKTISNQDRMLVASALGMAEIGDTGKFKWIGSSITSEAELRKRLDQLDIYLLNTQRSVDNRYFRTWKEFGVTPTRLVTEKQYTTMTPSAIKERKPKSPAAAAFKLILGKDGIYNMGTG